MATGPAAEPPPALVERIRARAAPDGFVPFDAFMDVALYAEGLGYYERSPGPIGAEGDFYTAPHVHPLFARTLAAKVRSVLESLPGPDPVRIVEIGPGDGRLADEILRELGRTRASEYVLVERSASLGTRALARARAAGEAVEVAVRRAPSVASLGPFDGMVFANELLDACPARRLRWNGTEWVELGVRAGPRGLVPADAPLREPVPPPALPERPEPGTIFEFSSSAEALVREVADHLVRGRCLVLDYGMDQSELVAGHPRGTLEAVRRHRPVSDPLAVPGESDLSVFVNFDRVRAAARSAGWTEVSFRSQAEALGAWGFPALLERALRQAPSSEEGVRLRLAAKNLLFGFERFRALELAPPQGADRPAVSSPAGASA